MAFIYLATAIFICSVDRVSINGRNTIVNELFKHYIGLAESRGAGEVIK